MNILIKLTCLIGLVIAPILGGHTTKTVEEVEETSHKIEMIDTTNDETKIEVVQK